MAEHSRLFLQLTSPTTGQIKGESSVADREGWIELDDYNWSLGRSTTDDAIPEPTVFTFGKEMDRSTTAMLDAMLKGTQLRGKIIVDDGSMDMLELTIAIEHITIKGYSFSTEITEKGGKVNEEWTFDYRWINFEYQQDAKSGVKSVKLFRPADAATGKPAGGKETEFRKLGAELLGGEFTVANLTKVWQEILEADAEAKKRPAKAPESKAQETKT